MRYAGSDGVNINVRIEQMAASKLGPRVSPESFRPYFSWPELPV